MSAASLTLQRRFSPVETPAHASSETRQRAEPRARSSTSALASPSVHDSTCAMAGEARRSSPRPRPRARVDHRRCSEAEGQRPQAAGSVRLLREQNQRPAYLRVSAARACAGPRVPPPTRSATTRTDRIPLSWRRYAYGAAASVKDREPWLTQLVLARICTTWIPGFLANHDCLRPGIEGMGTRRPRGWQ